MSGSMIRTRRIPIHHSLLRPQLLAGGERTLTILNVMTCSAMIFGIGGEFGIVGGIVIFAIVQWFLTMMARRDTQAFDVYRGHIALQKYYPAGEWIDAPYAPVINKIQG